MPFTTLTTRRQIPSQKVTMDVLETEMRLQTIIFLLGLVATPVHAEEPVKVAEGVCTFPWGDTPCDKYLYKGNVYILVWKDGEIWRLVKLTAEGEQLIFQAPTRYWT